MKKWKWRDELSDFGQTTGTNGVIYSLKYYKNIRYKNIIKSLGLVIMLDSRALSRNVTSNSIIILIIIFHLSVKIFIFLISQKNYGFSSIVIIVF